MSKKMKYGFTLIEVIVYLALLGILIAGLVSGAFAIVESCRRNDTHALLAEEGSFIIAKTQWELSGAEQVTQPSVGGSSAKLSLSRVEGYDNNGNLITAPVTFNPATLVGGRVALTSVHFYYAADAGTGFTPESVGLRFTLAARTSDGVLMSEEFFSTTSLRN